MIRYLTAIIGAIFMFVAVFIISAIFITPHLPDSLQFNAHIGDFGTNNIIGVILGLLAALSSFLATLKRRR